MHFIPCHAPGIGDLAGKFSEMPVILDHLARPGQGTAAEYEEVLKLARFPRVFMKFSRTGVAAASKLGPPYSDAKPVVKRIYESFGADRIVWGELGNNMPGFQKAREMLDGMLDFAPDAARARILGATAQKLFGFADPDSLRSGQIPSAAPELAAWFAEPLDHHLRFFRIS